MHCIQGVIPISPADHLVQLANKLDKHLIVGEKCNAFFEAFSAGTLLSTGFNREISLHLVQTDYSMSFSEMFVHLFNKRLEQWEVEHGTIALEMESLPSEEMDLISLKHSELKEKFDLCKKVNVFFREQVIELIRTDPGILLNKGQVFFPMDTFSNTGQIGECYCCETMNRTNRTKFTKALCMRSSSYIPKENPITIASIGVGEGFHELEIHAQLSARKYKVNQWVLVDPNLISKTAQRFETIVKWQNSDATVLSVEKKSDAYFAEVENGNTPPPDIFLFIDVEEHITTKHVEMFISKMKHRCLFAEFSKRISDSNFSETTKFTRLPLK